MTPEEKCCDLEHAKKLVEAGISFPDSYWIYNLWKSLRLRKDEIQHQIKYPAPDSDELLVWLKENLKYPIVNITHYGESWDCFNRNPKISFNNINLANALAELAVWVVKKGL